MSEQMIPAPAAGRDETAASRMGIIEINDLVYKLESDLSVAINRTHKNNYFQQTSYDPTQTSICILNSGADYIDPRRSFLNLSVLLPVTPVTAIAGDPNGLTWINAYFGPSGSVLNLIDSVVVSTRSGDELSRVNDFGQLMYNYIPWTFGFDWARTVGQEIGLGSFLPGSNSNGVFTNQGGSGNGTSDVDSSLLYNPRITFQVPLYLLSPVFTYGRLLPSMLMSGMKIEIRWKQLSVAAQQYWEGGLLYNKLGDMARSVNGNTFQGTYQHNMTQDRAYLMGGQTGAFTTTGLDPTITNATTFTLTQEVGNPGYYTFSIEAGHNSWAGVFANEQHGPTGDQRPWYSLRSAFIPGIDQIGWQNIVGLLNSEVLFDVITIIDGTSLLIRSVGGNLPNFAGATISFPGVFRQTRVPFQNRVQHAFNAPLQRYWNGAPTTATGTGLTGSTPLTTYTINNPFFQLCSVQLTDSIQRHLNEYSATNGLEIVYADWDRTTATLSGSNVAVYTEVRKSASRALQAFSVVVAQPSNLSYQQNSFAAIGFWQDYQFQLGSLYFPQQRVESKGTSDPIEIQDNMYTLTYAYACDAWDRWHPKAAPTIVSLRGDNFLSSRWDMFQTEQYEELRDDTVLVTQSNFGKTGSFCNGLQCVATTLERSTMFDLSGIPINNSRVLAIRGDFVIPAPFTSATQFVFLKYVRLARVFLINAEVEQ